MTVYRVKKSALTKRGACNSYWAEENRSIVENHGWIWKDRDQEELRKDGVHGDLAEAHINLQMRWYQSISDGHLAAWDVSELEPLDGDDTRG